MFNSVGDSSFSIKLEYLNQVISNHAREIGLIEPIQFLRINNSNFDRDNKLLHVECEIFQHLLN